MAILDPQKFRELVSGKKKGFTGFAFQLATSVAEIPYSWAVAWRNRKYDQGKKEIITVDAAVISVGNLTVGGTGKTPMVSWLCRYLRGQQIRVAIVSRGYGALKGSTENDEALELYQNLPDVPQVQNPDRVAGAKLAIEEFESQCIVLDDGFQHRRIDRDLDLVLLDALEPFGFEHQLPRGTLRESIQGLKRADIVILSRAGFLKDTQRRVIKERVQKISPTALWAEVHHEPHSLLNHQGEVETLEYLSGKKVIAFCAVGNPRGFEFTLQECGCEVLNLKVFPDHHEYQREDIESLRAWAETHQTDLILCTHKDLVKVCLNSLGPSSLYALRIGIQFLSGQEQVEQKLNELLVDIEPS